MAKTVTTPVTLRVPMDVYELLQKLATLRGVSPSAAAREVLHRAMIEGRLQSYIDPVAPSAAPAALTKDAPVPIHPPASDELTRKLDALFGGADEPASPAPAHAASTTTHAPQPDADEEDDPAAVWLDPTPEEQAKAARAAEKARIAATILTPEQTLARIAEGMAAVRSQPGHGYIEPYVRVDHAPHREPLTPDNSSQLPEPGTPEWVAMAERQGLPAEAIAEVVFATAPEGHPAPPAVEKPVSGSFDFDAWGD